VRRFDCSFANTGAVRGFQKVSILRRGLRYSKAVSVTLLKLACPDRVGLLARITGFVAFHGGNLLEVNQFTDPIGGWFFARLAIDTKTLALDLPAMRKAFKPTAD